MAEKIATFQEQPQFSQQTVIGGVEMRLRMTYRQRLASWYLDALDLDEVQIVTGRRLSPNFLPFYGLALETIDAPALPDGVTWYVEGPDEPTREDLGDTLVLKVIDTVDLAAIAAAVAATATNTDAVTVTVAP